MFWLSLHTEPVTEQVTREDVTICKSEIIIKTRGISNLFFLCPGVAEINLVLRESRAVGVISVAAHFCAHRWTAQATADLTDHPCRLHQSLTNWILESSWPEIVAVFLPAYNRHNVSSSDFL